MHVLITNDDGIHAEGLRTLVQAVVKAGHRVSVYAPAVEQSGAGASFSIFKPMRVEKAEIPGADAFSVTGTPVDCVRLAVYLMGEDKPDFALAGVNCGANRGAACLYSGTVNAALEASIHGIPAIAVSLCDYDAEDFHEAARLGVELMDWAQSHALPRGEIYNLNVPLGQSIPGIRPATLSNDLIVNPTFHRDENGCFVSMNTENILPEEDPDSDLLVTQAGYASLSILGWNNLSATPLADLGALYGKKEPLHQELEIERKYLIRMPDVEALAKMPGCRIWHIEQTYLYNGRNHETRRIRRIESAEGIKYIFTFKRHISGLVQEERERELSVDEYETLRRGANSALKPIHKTRFRIPYENQLVEVDIFDFWSDRGLMEIELKSDDQSVKLPPWLNIIREVTGEKAYKNRQLAEKPIFEKIQ